MNLLISTFEDTVRTNQLLQDSQSQLTEAKDKIERYAQQLEGKVQFAEEKYKLLLENATDAVIGSDLEGRIFTWNRGAETLFGYLADEILGQFTATLVPADHREEMEKLRRLAVQDENASNYETIMLKRNGERVEVSVTKSPIKDPQGTIVGVSTISPFIYSLF